MRFFILFFALLSLGNSEDFITKMEYAKMLYSNPRGIGCDLCHGKKGEGAVISKFKIKGMVKELKAPAITNLDKKRFEAALGKSDSVMPKYYLTQNEIDMLYFYVTSEVNK